MRAQLCRLCQLTARIVADGFTGLLSEQLNDQRIGTDLAFNSAGIKDTIQCGFTVASACVDVACDTRDSGSGKTLSAAAVFCVTCAVAFGIKFPVTEWRETDTNICCAG